MNQKSTIQLPPICLIGAPGAGKRTVARMLTEMTGYKACPRNGEADNKCGIQPFLRAYVIDNDRAHVERLREEGFRVLYVFAPASTRAARLGATSVPTSDDHGPTALADYSIANIDGLDELREELADVLSRMQS